MDDPLSQFAEQNNTAVEESLEAPQAAEPEIEIPQDAVEEVEVEEKEQDQEQGELPPKEAPTSSVFNLSSYDVTQEPNDIVQVTRVLNKVYVLL